MRLVLMAACLGLVSSNCFADVTGDTCIKIAETVATQAAKQLSSTQISALQYNTVCRSDETSSSSAVNILAEAFAFGGKMSESDKQNYCKKDISQMGFNQSDIIVTKSVFRDGLDVVSQCLRLASIGWDIKYKQYTDAVSVNIAFRGGSNEIKGVDIIPADSASCKDLPPFPARVNADGLSFICERKNKITGDGDVKTTSAEQSIINVRLGGEIFSVQLAAYSRTPVDGLRSDLTSANTKLDAVQQENASLKSKLSVTMKALSGSRDLLNNVEDRMIAARDLNQGSLDNSSDAGTCSRHGRESRDIMNNSVIPTVNAAKQTINNGLSFAQ